ncbi:MAG: D-glycero-beta-D-manno-heptose 1,7-bisphosphate 7-phosphatase [Methylotenera sp.]
MKLVILDRDGVINRDSANFIKNTNEWIALPGSLEAIALLNQSGFRIAIATNQSGIARGLFDMTTLNAINDKMYRALGQMGGRIDAMFYCPHAVDDNCNCRKPKTGMIEDIGRRFSVELSEVYGIGDSLRDLQAFSDAGCKPILVRSGKGEETLAQAKLPNQSLPKNTLIFADLNEAAQHIIAEEL